MPWSLCIGDLRANLEELLAGPMPEEQVAQQLGRLGQFGYPFAKLLRILALIKEIPWSTLVTEQVHGIVAALHRIHPNYGSNILSARAMVALLRRLLHCQTKLEKEGKRIDQRLKLLSAKRPQMVFGK